MRADARRNRDRILTAAGQAFSEHGPHLSLDEIARRAEVSPATLFRHFPNRNELVAAVIERRFAEDVEPVIADALANDDAWQGLVSVVGAILRVGTTSTAWRETIVMAKEAGLMSETTRERFQTSLRQLFDRAKRDGAVRPDVTASDLRPIIAMLRALVATDRDLPPDGWRRYLSLLLRAQDVATRDDSHA